MSRNASHPFEDLVETSAADFEGQLAQAAVKAKVQAAEAPPGSIAARIAACLEFLASRQECVRALSGQDPAARLVQASDRASAAEADLARQFAGLIPSLLVTDAIETLASHGDAEDGIEQMADLVGAVSGAGTNAAALAAIARFRLGTRRHAIQGALAKLAASVRAEEGPTS